MKVKYGGIKYECSDAEGERLIAAGLAERIGDAPAPVAAAQREKATKRRPGAEKRG
jgi:hypothetical protein